MATGAVSSSFGFNHRVHVNRRQKNPLDKCTLVSVYPRPITDFKPTVMLSTLTIAGADNDDFSILIIDGGGWLKEMDEGMPHLEIPVTSMQQGDSFIRDHCNGLLGYIPEVSAPGLFLCLGAFDKLTILKYVDPLNGKNFKTLIEEARARQKRWFHEIVQIADVDWSRTGGNVRSVNDLQKMAAEQLNLKEKPWLADFTTINKSNCPACGMLVNPAFPVCPTCKAIVNPERAKELGIQFASK